MRDDAFDGRLLQGERIVWSGAPKAGIVVSARDVFLIPFSLLWCGFAIFWTFMASRTPASAPFDLFGAVFVCIGLFFVFGRFLLDAWLRRGMCYALTDRRILIARPGPFADFTSVNLSGLPQAGLSERPDGSGTIRFGQPAPMWGGRTGFSVWLPSLDPTPQFLNIAEARRVFDLVQRSGGQG